MFGHFDDDAVLMVITCVTFDGDIMVPWGFASYADEARLRALYPYAFKSDACRVETDQ